MLSPEKLEVLVAKRNESGFKHTVEVMTKTELKEYRENCMKAINKYKEQIVGNQPTMDAIRIENMEVLEGYVAYIDSVLAEPKKDVIDTFLANWKDNAFEYYMGLRKQYENLMKVDPKITAENLALITDAWGRQKLSDETIEKLVVKADKMAQYELNNWKTSIRSAMIKEFKDGITKNELSVIDSMYRPDKAEQILNDILDHQVKQRKLLLIGRITKKAGNIVDASGLYIANNGEINGTIIGDKKTVNVNTVYAGGHSVQCLHYRVLVK